MKSKKIIIAAASVALVAVLGVGGTLAYFTDQDSKTNVFTTGKVDIALSETTDDETAELTNDGIEYDDILPGDVVSKIPTVTVSEDSADCFLRVKIDYVNGDAEGENAVDEASWAAATMPTLDTDDYSWFLHDDGYYYYEDEDGNLIVASAEDEIDIFSTTTIPTAWNNAFAGKSFSMQITAYAVQADNFDGSADAWEDAFPEADAE